MQIFILLSVVTNQALTIIAADLGVQSSTLMADDVCLGEGGQAFPHCQAGFIQTRAHSTNEMVTKRDGSSQMSQTMSSTELQELQMSVAAAWVEADHLYEQHENFEMDDTSDSDVLKVPIYREFEVGATANLGNGTDFWHPGMREWINWVSDMDVKEGPTKHIQLRRKIGARMFIAETDEQDAWICDNVTFYASLYHHELQQRTSILLSDVSKSGGIEFCKCGFQAGCRADPTHDFQCNAGIPAAQKASQQLLSKARDCGALSRFHEKYNITLQDYNTRDFYLKAAKRQRHFPLINGGLCHEFWNVIVLRDPFNRLIAQLSLLNEMGKAEFWNPHHVTPQIIFDTIPIIGNNFYTRSLIGSVGFQLPFGNITSEHLDQSKAILEKFDLVLMKTATLRDDLYTFMGWTCNRNPDKPEREAVPAIRHYSEVLAREWGMDKWQKLREANEHDFQLVKYARELERLDKKVFRHPYFSFFTRQIQYKKCHDNNHCGFMCK